MDSFFTRLVLSNDHAERIGRHVIFWIFAWFFQGVIYAFMYPRIEPMTFVLSFTEALLYLPMHMFLSYSVSYIVLPKLLFKGKYWLGFGSVLALIVMTALLSPVSLNLLIEPFRGFIGAPSKARTIFYSFMGGLRGSLTVSGFFIAIKLLKHWYLKSSENERLEKEKLRAELELLKNQLHPHFMFNTLNSIYSMALRNSQHTAEAIHKLSNLMRYMITECNTTAIALEQEIRVIQTYIELEKGRLGDRLDHSMNINGELSGHIIAPLLLLPFVENSFKHGAFMVEDQAWVSLDIVLKDDQFVFKLINGKNNTVKPPQSGLGLVNVKKTTEPAVSAGTRLTYLRRRRNVRSNSHPDA
ncbi:MAG: sensor histidine kinase [Bacteroidota bacterium]